MSKLTEEDIFLAGPVYVITLIKNNEIEHQFLFSKLKLAEMYKERFVKIYPDHIIDLQTHKVDVLSRVDKFFNV